MPNDGGGGGVRFTQQYWSRAQQHGMGDGVFAHRLLRKAKRNTTLQSASPRPPRLSGGMDPGFPSQVPGGLGARAGRVFQILGTTGR